jgi:hypothetical protein
MEFHRIRLLLGVMLAFAFPNSGMAQLALNVNALGSVRVSNNIPYNITLVNTSQGQVFSGVVVSSTYSPSLDFVSATPQDGNVTFTRENNTARFVVQQLVSNQVLNLTLRPNVITGVTNLFTATIGQFTVRTNVSTTVTEAPGTADVMVTITPPPQPIIVNDWVTFGVHLVNRGGGTVSGIILTNTFTNGPVQLKGFSSAGIAIVAQNPTRLIYNVGSLIAGQTTNFQIRVQPTVATNLVLTSRFRSSGNADTNAANNVAARSVAVQLPGSQLSASIESAQIFNPQNALMEQVIRVFNNGSNAVPSARLVLSNISYAVINALGTNNGNPFVVHPATIQPTQGVDLLLEYFIPSREPGPKPQLSAYSIGDFDAAASTVGTNIAITNIAWRMPFGVMQESNLVLQFPARRGAVYEIQYATNTTFSGGLRALPALVSQANRVQWIDYGPPKTTQRPILGPTVIQTNVVTTNSVVTTNDMVVTNITYVTNDMMITTNTDISTITVVSTNDVPETNQISLTNLNMRFYRAIELR